MNVIRERLKCINTIAGNLVQITRGYAVQKKLPITWISPVKPSCISKEKSGDGGLELNITPEDYMINFDRSKELEDADEIVKKMFQVGFNRRSHLISIQKNRAVELVNRHAQDFGSMEARIAKITVTILQLMEHQENFKKNIRTKVLLKELIEKRQKWLKKLRMQDYPRFEFLLERLNLIYRPFPEENPRIKRKACTKQLLEKYCDELVKTKLNDYRQELEAQQKDFFKEKAEKLEFIRNEELACGATPTVSEEEIEAAKQKAASFV